MEQRCTRPRVPGGPMRRGPLSVLLASLLIAACGGGSSGVEGETGGAPGSGGAQTGGHTGGNAGTAGARAGTGGASSTGGVLGSGGSSGGAAGRGTGGAAG